jgi:hypothetical protein
MLRPHLMEGSRNGSWRMKLTLDLERPTSQPFGIGGSQLGADSGFHQVSRQYEVSLCTLYSAADVVALCDDERRRHDVVSASSNRLNSLVDFP